MQISGSELDGQARRRPVRGVVVTALSVAVMAAIALLLWDRLPEEIVTREATASRSGTEISRTLAVLITPLALLVVAGAMAASSLATRRIRGRLGPALTVGPAATTRSIDSVFTLLAPFFLAVHLAVLLPFAGVDAPIDRILAAALGILLIGLGNLLPATTPTGTPDAAGASALALAWQRAQRPGGVAMVGIGALTVVAALVLPPMAVAVSAAFSVLAVYLFMVAAALRRLR